MRGLVRVALIPVALLAVQCGEPVEPGQQVAAITDGVVHSGHPAVGLLLTNGSTACAPQMQGSLCTVTLVGQKTLLTAAHCIVPQSTNIVCFDTLAATYTPVSLVAHPGWDPVSKLNDVALIVLDNQPPLMGSIVSWETQIVGHQVTFVGYGTTGETLKDAGIKRIASNTIASVETTRFSYTGTGGGVGNTCYGDSGGPAFATVGGKEVQVGVTSAGVKPCGTKGYSTRLDSFRTWLETTAAGDLLTDVPDTTRPQVSILEPSDGAGLAAGSITVKASATDNVGVTSVELLLNGVSAGAMTGAPFSRQVTLSGGTHTLKVVARDQAGNSGEAQVTVTGTAPSGTFGAPCDDNTGCISKLCGTYGTIRFCTQICDAASPCPQGAECLPAGAQSLCGPPPTSHSFTGGDVLVGGCGVTPGRDPAPGLVLLVFVLWALWRA